MFDLKLTLTHVNPLLLAWRVLHFCCLMNLTMNAMVMMAIDYLKMAVNDLIDGNLPVNAINCFYHLTCCTAIYCYSRPADYWRRSGMISDVLFHRTTLGSHGLAVDDALNSTTAAAVNAVCSISSIYSAISYAIDLLMSQSSARPLRGNSRRTYCHADRVSHVTTAVVIAEPNVTNTTIDENDNDHALLASFLQNNQRTRETASDRELALTSSLDSSVHRE